MRAAVRITIRCSTFDDALNVAQSAAQQIDVDSTREITYLAIENDTEPPF